MKRVSERETSRCWHERLKKMDIQMVLLGYWNAYCKCESVNCKKLYDSISCNISSQETWNRVDNWRRFLTFQVNTTQQTNTMNEVKPIGWFSSVLLCEISMCQKRLIRVFLFLPGKFRRYFLGPVEKKKTETPNPKPFRKKTKIQKRHVTDASGGGGLLWLGTSLLFMNASSRLRADGLKGTMVAGNLGAVRCLEKNLVVFVDLKGDFFWDNWR